MLTAITLEQLPSYEIGYEKGIEKGKMEAIRSGVVNIYAFTKDIKEIAQMFSITEEQVVQMLKQKGKAVL